MQVKALFGEPKGHGLIYSTVFLQELARQVPVAINVTETNGTATENDKVMEVNPTIFYHVGHGSYDRFTVECRADYIDRMTGERLGDFKDKVIHLLSCETGQRLGPNLVEHGAKAFVGYDDVFYYGVVEETQPDPAPHSAQSNYQDYYSFIDCDVEVERQFLTKGKTLKQAVAASQDKFDEYIKKYSTGEWKDTYIAPYMIRFLRHDKENQVTYGNVDIKATGEEIPPTEEYLDPLRYVITTVEKVRPKVFIKPLEGVVSGMANTIIKHAPEVKIKR